jgi:hypothetical protein
MPERVSAIHNVLTDVTGELVAHPTSAAKAHRSFISELERRELWYHTYLRTAITAGGFKRDANRVIPDVVAGNTETALLAETWLGFTGAIDPTHTWNAVSLGYVPHFKQSDYLEFCFYGIVRPEQKDLLTIERRFARNLAHSAVDLAVFNSHEPNEVRIPHYLAFTDVFWDTIKDEHLAPVDTVVGLFDNGMSLGGRGEDRLSKLASIRQIDATFPRGEVAATARDLARFSTLLTELGNLGVPEITA